MNTYLPWTPAIAAHFAHKRRLARLVAAEDEPASAPTITGTRTVGQTLTAVFANDDPNGPASNITYQWKRDGAPLGGATVLTYVLVAGDAAHVVTVAVSYTDPLGSRVTVESESAGVIS